MELNKARELALKLMQENNLEGWAFRFISSFACFGWCKGSKKEIQLSQEFIKLNIEERVKKTIIHEIAHALTPREHHSYIWQMKCIQLGGDGQRYLTVKDTVMPEIKKYLYECPNCHKIITQSYISRKCPMACWKCCEEYNEGSFDKRFILIFKGEKNGQM